MDRNESAKLTVWTQTGSSGEPVTVIEGDADSGGALDEMIAAIRRLAVDQPMRLDLTKLRGLTNEHIAQLVDGVEDAVEVVGQPTPSTNGVDE